MNLGDFIGRNARRHGDRTAIVDGERSVSFREFDERSNRLGRWMLEAGLATGDRVAIFLSNRLEFFDAAFGLPKAGLVSIYLSHRLTSAELGYQLADSGASALIVSDDLASVVEGADLAGVTVVMQTGSEYEDNLAAMSGERLCVELAPNAPLSIVYTSGTSGRPKGAIQSHENWYWYTIGHLIHIGMRPDDRVLVAGPLVFSGRGHSYSALFRGATQVVLRKFDAAATLAAIQEHKITATTLVPTMIYMLLELIETDDADLSSLRRIIYGGAPMAPDRLQQCLDRFGPIFTQSYGLTEVTGGATYLERDEHVAGAPQIASAGRAAFGMECAIVDGTGQHLPPDAVGEICLRGPNVFTGYLNNEELTAERFDDGWFHTGDIGRLDDNGYLYILDRKSDMIISGGHNVYPREVEDVLLSHAAVAEAAVVSVPDPTWGEAVTAVVRLRAGSTTTSDALIAHCRGPLAGYKVPKTVLLSPIELPRNTNGKLLRRTLRDELTSSGSGA